MALTLVALLIAGVVGVAGNTSNVYVTQLRGSNKQIAENLLETFRTIPLSELVAPSKIEEWLSGADPVLDTIYVDPQMPPLQIVATYWALNSTRYRQKAEIIMGYLLKNLAEGYKYQLIINNYTSPYLTFDNSYEDARDVGSATIMVSGFVANETPRGYVAKAYLTKLVTSQEKLVGIQRVLAGGYYCANPIPTSYNDYPLTISSLYVEYQTVPGDANTVQYGRFRLSGYYNNSNVDVDKDLSGWSVDYDNVYVYGYGYTGRIVITDGVNTIRLYLDREFSRFTTSYDVWAIVYEDANGNRAVVYLNSGIYVEISWSWSWIGWYISSSRAYTTVPSIDSAVYRIPIPPYYCPDTSMIDNSLYVNFSIMLPNDADVTEGTLNLATRMGENIEFKINGNTVTYTGVRALDVTQYFSGGANPVEAHFYNPQGNEMGFGSGSWISLKYKTSTPQVDNPGLVKLYNITSEGTGIYYLNSLFVPGNITGINIRLTVEGVHEVRVYYSNGTALNLIYENTSVSPGLSTVAINNATLVSNLTKYISLQELSKRNFNLIIMLDAYYNPNYNPPVRYAGQDYRYEWNNQRILYGYPYSYINITYTPAVTRTRFMIPIEQTYSPNGENPVYWQSWWGWYLAGYQTMYFDYYLPDRAIPWYVDTWTAIHFLGYPEGTTTFYEGPNANTKVFEFPLDYYLIRLAYTRLSSNIMMPGETNRFKLESSSEDYVFRVYDSRAIVHYFLNGYAPYGKVFLYYAQDHACGYNLTYWYDLGNGAQQGSVLIGNCRPSETPIQKTTYDMEPWLYALDDAIYRLFVQLGAEEYQVEQIKLDSTLFPGTQENPIRIELRELAGKAIGIKNVPTSGKAIEITLRIWRGG